MMVSPFELKSKQFILSEFSRNTLATLKLRSTLSVSFMMACLFEGKQALAFYFNSPDGFFPLNYLVLLNVNVSPVLTEKFNSKKRVKSPLVIL